MIKRNKKGQFVKGFKQIKVNKNRLYQLYVVEKRPMKDVAKIMNLTYSTVRNRLVDFKWKRTRQEALKGHYVSEETKEKISNSLKENTPWNKGLTKKDPRIAKQGRTFSLRYKGKLSPTKGSFKKGQVPWNKNKKFLALDKNPNWQNGKSFEPYGIEFNNSLKEKIRKRDKYRCQECFRHQDELYTKSGTKYKLNVHHIDYDKKNNNEDNLISLCKACHTQTNFSRKDWKKYFERRVSS